MKTNEPGSEPSPDRLLFGGKAMEWKLSIKTKPMVK
jgi:hypothetical protein